MTRRAFLAASAASTAKLRAADSWQPGEVVHLLPTSSDRRILLKASFRSAQQAPRLRVGKRDVAGARSDTAGFYWRFDADGLAPGEEHRLELVDARRRSLCDPWPLKTFPALEERPKRFRLLVYTCAGGDERVIHPSGGPSFLSVARRRRMFDRALSFQPDAAVGNGDHTYWDLYGTGFPPRYQSEELKRAVGVFDRSLPVLGTANEDVLKRVGEAQIASIYGTRFRSTPIFITQDDHDYFENDEANDRMVTFPPDHMMLQLGRGVRRLWFPEFLPDPNRPAGLPGASAADTPPGTGESYGTIRYGKLAEVLLFDCRRYLSLAGPNAWLVPPETEQWLTARMKDPSVLNLVNLPSMPPVWTAGKWGDWGPDVLGPDGELTNKVEKPFWQEGWARQHDRLMKATSEQPERIPLWISGDMHAHGQALVQRAGQVDLSRNPVNVFLSGAVSTQTGGWPSGVRKTPPKVSSRVSVETPQPALEENGFLIVDFEESGVTVRSFKWLPRDGDDALDSLEPFRTAELRA